jgi:hypothetical protein
MGSSMGWLEEYQKLSRDQRLIVEHKILQEIRRILRGKALERQENEPRQDKLAKADKKC